MEASEVVQQGTAYACLRYAVLRCSWCEYVWMCTCHKSDRWYTVSEGGGASGRGWHVSDFGPCLVHLLIGKTGQLGGEGGGVQQTQVCLLLLIEVAHVCIVLDLLCVQGQKRGVLEGCVLQLYGFLWYFHAKFVVFLQKGYEIWHAVQEVTPRGRPDSDAAFTLLVTVPADVPAYTVKNPKPDFDHLYKVRVADAQGYPGAFAECGFIYAPPPGEFTPWFTP